MKVKNLKIKLNRVMKVYSGKPGCMCGCKGNYRVAAQHWAAANKYRGYDYHASDVNDRQVARVIRILEQQPEIEAEENYIYAEVNGRAYAVYFI